MDITLRDNVLRAERISNHNATSQEKNRESHLGNALVVDPFDLKRLFVLLIAKDVHQVFGRYVQSPLVAYILQLTIADNVALHLNY